MNIFERINLKIMKNVLVLFFGVFVNLISPAKTFTPVTADNPLIEYTGRIDFSNTQSPKFSYSGVSIRAYFRGTSISIILNDEGNQNYFNIILDNRIIERLQSRSGLNTYYIADTLEDTIHEIEIFRLTEEMFGKTEFHGFILDEDKSLVNIPNSRTRLIEFIGNSITCGYGNEGVNGEIFGPATQNHYLTYAAITSRSFNARHLAICKSGIGVYRNWDGPAEGNTDCMPNRYERIFLNDETPLFNFDEKPDLICIDLGTNDFSTNKGDSIKYISSYLKFIDTLQLINKGTDILCLLGPMLSDKELDVARGCLRLIVDSANNKNRGNVYFFEMSQQTGDLGIGIDYHPTTEQHLKNAAELIEYISIIKNWSINPLMISGNAITNDEIILTFNTQMCNHENSYEGFSVIADNVSIPVLQSYPDICNKSKIHISLAKNLSENQKIFVSYLPGSIQGNGNMRLNKSFVDIKYRVTSVLK